MTDYWQKLSKMTVAVRTLLEQLIDGVCTTGNKVEMFEVRYPNDPYPEI